MQEAIAVKSNSVEVTGLPSDVSQFLNSDKWNKMILTDKQKAVMENYFNENGWNAYKIWNKYSSFESFGMSVRNLIKQKLKSRFVKNTDWPPKSPDCNPLDYYFWDRVQEKVHDS